jgi:hypothetical protein
VVVPVVVFHRLGVVADEVGRFLYLAERLDPVLADLVAHVCRVVEQAVADQLGSAAQDLQALAPRRRGPGRLCPAGGRDGLVDIGGRATRERPQEDVRVDRRARLERPDAIAPRPVDVVAVIPAELAARLPGSFLERRMQLLVVGAQRRVRDLDARLGLGRHGRSLVNVA